MNGVIQYVNTDLDLTSATDLSPLAESLRAAGVFPLHVTQGEDGLWYATFEVYSQQSEPAPDIAVMLSVVESLAEPLRAIWDTCTRREFNIGYDCGLKPWAFSQGLSAGLLGRIAGVGASLWFTLYPDKPMEEEPTKEHPPPPSLTPGPHP